MKYLPEEVASSFWKMAMMRQEAQEVPGALKDTRQANLIQPRKVKDGALDAGDTRPINIECI